MQGVFILAVIVALLTAAAGITWRVAISRKHAAETQEQEARAAETDRDDTPRAGRSRGYDPYEHLGRGPSRSQLHADRAESADQFRFWAKIVTFSLAGLTALLVLVSSFWIVGTSSIGVVTSFGRPVSTLPNGPGWTAPWDNVTELDYTVQVTDFTASSCEVQLRLANSQIGCPKVNVRWQPNKADADTLFRRYKSTQGVENGVLIPALQKYANEVFQNYDPVGALSSPVPVGSAKNPSTSQLADQLEKRLSDVIGSEVTVDFLSIPNIAYPAAVQNRMNTILQQKASTQAAILAEQTATAQAAANRTIAASVSHDPNVLTARCLDLMAEIVKNGGTPPVNMCNLGGSGSGLIVSAGH